MGNWSTNQSVEDFQKRLGYSSIWWKLRKPVTLPAPKFPQGKWIQFDLWSHKSDTITMCKAPLWIFKIIKEKKGNLWIQMATIIQLGESRRRTSPALPHSGPWNNPRTLVTRTTQGYTSNPHKSMIHIVLIMCFWWFHMGEEGSYWSLRDSPSQG